MQNKEIYLRMTDINDMITGDTNLKVHIPSNNSNASYQPITLYDPELNINGAFIVSGKHEIMPASWEELQGFYILLSHKAPDERYKVYVGKTQNNFRNRLQKHYQSKQYWNVALLVYKPKLTTTEIEFLEGRMLEEFVKDPYAEVQNIAKAGNSTLLDADRNHMEKIIYVASKFLALRGYPLSQYDQSTKVLSPQNIVVAQKPTLPPRPTMSPNMSTLASTHIVVASIDIESKIFEALRVWRTQKAKEKAKEMGSSYPAYCVLPDAVLKELSVHRPQTITELLTIHGIKQDRATTYGEDVLNIIRLTE